MLFRQNPGRLDERRHAHEGVDERTGESDSSEENTKLHRVTPKPKGYATVVPSINANTLCKLIQRINYRRRTQRTHPEWISSWNEQLANKQWSLIVNNYRMSWIKCSPGSIRPDRFVWIILWNCSRNQYSVLNQLKHVWCRDHDLHCSCKTRKERQWATFKKYLLQV